MKNYQKFLRPLAAAFGLTLVFSLTSCGGGEDNTITVGATPSPHAEILEQVKPLLEEQGYTLVIQEFTDYVLPNTALSQGEIDANFFQHKPYLDNFNAENGTDLVSAATVHFEPLGIYAGKTTSLDQLPENAKIAVPNDTTNEARALLLLEQKGIITLKEGAGLQATKQDIAENPHNVEIVELAAEQIARSLPDVDLGVINGNYALSGKVTEKLLPDSSESTDSEVAATYANILAVRPEEQDSPAIQALVDALHSDTVREYIETTYQGLVLPYFG